ncbi:MAG TPA: class I SAM-dependent methyltransferase, partial [Bacteroidetes bacterium]|nr:class I SAM-dependent methyltransferase [Bacteroidota bacterium]
MNDLLIVLASSGAGVLLLILAIWWGPKGHVAAAVEGKAAAHAENGMGEKLDNPALGVGAFYDAQTDAFLQVYGEVIQAFRTRDVRNLLDAQVKAIGLKEGLVAIDAGCGVAGPACYFAGETGAEIHAVTISAVQAEKARLKVMEKGLESQVKVVHGDYHELDALFPENSVDIVYFLESFGHSHDKEKAIAAAWKVLKPGGKLYIKDLFLKEVGREAHRAVMAREVERINTAYHYHIADLYAVLGKSRSSVDNGVRVPPVGPRGRRPMRPAHRLLFGPQCPR